MSHIALQIKRRQFCDAAIGLQQSTTKDTLSGQLAFSRVVKKKNQKYLLAHLGY